MIETPKTHEPVVSDGEASGLSLYRTTPQVCQTPNRPFLRGINRGEKRAVFFRPRCKSWACPACANINRSLWVARAFSATEALQEEGQTISFLTLTSHEKLDFAGSIAVWPNAWKKLSTRTRRAACRFEYLLIPEQHEDGRLHVHAIETAALGKRWFKDNARACGLGFMADEEPARSPRGAAGYVSKYLGKSLGVHRWPKNFRRVRTSHGWPKSPPMPELPGWLWIALPKDESLQAAIDRLEAEGFQVAILDHKAAWDYANENAPE